MTDKSTVKIGVYCVICGKELFIEEVELENIKPEHFNNIKEKTINKGWNWVDIFINDKEHISGALCNDCYRKIKELNGK